MLTYIILILAHCDVFLKKKKHSLCMTEIFTFKSVRLFLSTRWRRTWPAEVRLHSFLTSALNECEWLPSDPVYFNPPLTRESITAPIQQEALWTPEAIRTFWRRHKSLDPAAIRTPARPARGLVTETMYVSPNNEAPSCSHCYRATAISITHSACMSVDFGMQRACNIL